MLTTILIWVRMILKISGVGFAVRVIIWISVKMIWMKILEDTSINKGIVAVVFFVVVFVMIVIGAMMGAQTKDSIQVTTK